jgi:hypothetical protein
MARQAEGAVKRETTRGYRAWIDPFSVSHQPRRMQLRASQAATPAKARLSAGCPTRSTPLPEKPTAGRLAFPESVYLKATTFKLTDTSPIA